MIYKCDECEVRFYSENGARECPNCKGKNVEEVDNGEIMEYVATILLDRKYKENSEMEE